MEIAIGGPPPYYIAERQKKIFCPSCARSTLRGISPTPAPQLASQKQKLVLPANVPWKPPWRK